MEVRDGRVGWRYDALVRADHRALFREDTIGGGDPATVSGGYRPGPVGEAEDAGRPASVSGDMGWEAYVDFNPPEGSDPPAPAGVVDGVGQLGGVGGPDVPGAGERRPVLGAGAADRGDE